MAKLAIVQSLDAIATPAVATPSVVTLKPQAPKATPSPKAIAYDYASHFKADVISAAFNAELVRLAQSGRIFKGFVLAMAVEGFTVPETKAGFQKWATLNFGDKIPPFKSAKKSNAFKGMVNNVLDCLGLDKLPGYYADKAKAVKATPEAYKPSAELQAIESSIRKLDTLDKKAANWLIDAIRSQVA